MKEGSSTSSMRYLVDLLQDRTGQTLSENRMWRIEAALGPVMREHGFSSLDALVRTIKSDITGPLATQAVDALLNNETSFFRDPPIFHLLGDELLQVAMKRAVAQGRSGKLRVWCAGCSSGQEAWSIAMLFRNGQSTWPDWDLEILATDISQTAIAQAQSGVVSQMEAQRGLPIADMVRWMEPDGDNWRINAELCDMIDFRVDNLCAPEATTGTYDIILCRNVLLYFDPDKKQQILAFLDRHSAPGSWLLLGAGETTIGLEAQFSSSATYRGVYERVEAA